MDQAAVAETVTFSDQAEKNGEANEHHHGQDGTFDLSFEWMMVDGDFMRE